MPLTGFRQLTNFADIAIFCGQWQQPTTPSLVVDQGVRSWIFPFHVRGLRGDRIREALADDLAKAAGKRLPEPGGALNCVRVVLPASRRLLNWR
jgi:hypothetical protein